MPVQLSTDQQALQALSRALKAEEDGKKLRRDLAKNLREALEPAKQEIRSGLMGMARSGGSSPSPALRTVVLSKLKAEARLSGRSTGARMRIRQTPELRGFAHAPKRLNRKKGWRHKTFGKDVWVHQVGEPEYFDRPFKNNPREYRAAVLAAMEEMAQRIAKKV